MARPRSMGISSWIVYASAVALTLLSGRAAAQDICACSPSTYTFTLDFSLSCPPVNVTRNPGITATFCQVSPLGDGNQTIDELEPVAVEYIDVLELGQQFEVLSQTNITGVFEDGDSFDYTSITGAEGYDGEIPRVVQLNIFALNEFGERVVNFYAISFSNLCDAYPTLEEGGSSGWTKFAALEAPDTALCPVVPTEGPEPTGAPVADIIETLSPTEVMSMDMSIVEDLIADIEMSMAMSMSYAATRSFFRLYEKSDKSEKKSKSDKSDKSEKSSKSDKKSKKRRLRVRPLYEAN